MTKSLNKQPEMPDTFASPAAGLLPPMQGLYIGKVTKIDEDPDGEYKIQVKIPFLDPACDMVWARLNSVRASNGYGSFFIPDIDDEVILGYFNNDPRFPVILGSLYSSKQKPPYEIEATNKISAFVSKEKMKIEFEEEKKIITISTPGNNKIVLSDDTKGIFLEDQNGNKITMDDKGISIESTKDITIKAKAKVLTDAGADVGITAKSNVKAEGINVELQAKASLKAKGNASAELSASGPTVVKGAMVMIN